MLGKRYQRKLPQTIHDVFINFNKTFEFVFPKGVATIV